MRLMPCLPKRRNRELPRLHFSGLFRARAALAGGIRCLSVWRTLGIHNCTAERARQAARQCQLRSGGAIWISWHGLRRNTQGRGRSRTLTPNQRDRRYVGPLRRIGGIGNRVTKILGTGRNQALLERVKALAPARIEVFAVGKRLVQQWAMEVTDNEGVDAVIDTLPPGAPASAMLDALRSLRRGGRAVDVGGVAETLPLNVHWMMGMNIQLIGSCWFTTGEGQEMAEMARVGTLDLSALQHRRISLRDINDALSSLQDANRGFNNFVVIP